MIQKHPLPKYFQPSFEKDYYVPGIRITVRLQYHGPVPSFNRPVIETFMFDIHYKGGSLIESGSIEWPSENGPLTLEEAAKAVVIYWNTTLRNNS